MNHSTDFPALAIDRLHGAQHAAGVFGHRVSADVREAIHKIALAGVPTRQGLTRNRAIQQPLGLYSTAAVNQHGRRRQTFLAAKIQYRCRQCLRRAPGQRRHPVSVEVGKQQAKPQEVDDSPIGPNELSLGHPRVTLFVQQIEYFWHISQAMRRLALFTSGVDEQRKNRLSSYRGTSALRPEN